MSRRKGIEVKEEANLNDGCTEEENATPNLTVMTTFALRLLYHEVEWLLQTHAVCSYLCYARLELCQGTVQELGICYRSQD